jgi:glutamate synthase domain-containing protein 3
MEFIDLERLDPSADPDEATFVRTMIENHQKFTDSPLAARILDNWDAILPQFVKIMPRDYKRALEELAQEEAARDEPAAQPANV